MCNHSDMPPDCTATVYAANTLDDKAALLRPWDQANSWLLKSEALALQCSDFQAVIENKGWRDDCEVRPLFEHNRLARCSPHAESTLRALRNMHERIPDVKAAYHVQQELRDTKRVSRHPRVSREKIPYIQHNSHVFGKRDMPREVAVSEIEICRAPPGVNTWECWNALNL